MEQDLNLPGPLGIIHIQHVTPMELKCLHEKTSMQSRFWQLGFGPCYLAPLHVSPHAPSLELICRWSKNLLSCLLLFWLKVLGSWVLLFYKEILKHHLTETKSQLSLVKRATLNPQVLKSDMVSWKSCLFKMKKGYNSSWQFTGHWSPLTFFLFYNNCFLSLSTAEHTATLRAKMVQGSHRNG